MFLFIKERRVRLFCKVLSCVISVVFAVSTISPSIAMAQNVGILSLPIPGTMVNVSPAFVPVLLKGMTIFPDNPLKFDFILDSGNTDLTQDEMRKESERLVKYFLASMTVPKDDLWVNLSPYEDDRIIPDELGKTELGRDLLAQDYLLKQLTASLMYPEDELGKEFWNRVYEKAEEQFGTTDIPVDTFNKVWILPESATVYENEQTVYVVQSRLKVMLDSDYIAMSNGTENANSDSTMEIGESIIREIIIPEIEKEVNEGKNFALLRQIYHSLILAKWYKETIKNSLLSQVYVDQNKTSGVELDDTGYKEEIYAQYIEAYKKGVFDLIKEDYDELSQEVVSKKYFSGGIKDADIELGKTSNARMINSSVVGKSFRLEMEVEPQKDGEEIEIDNAMLGSPWTLSGARVFLGNYEQYSEKQLIKAINMIASSPDKESEDIERLKEMLKTESPAIRQEVEKYLTDGQKFEGYVNALPNIYAIDFVGKSGNEKAKVILQGLLSDSRRNVRQTAEKYLTEEQKLKGYIQALPKEFAIERVKKVLSSDNFDIRKEAEVHLTDKQKMEGYIGALPKKFAIDFLGESRIEQAIIALKNLLSNSNSNIRQEAEKYLTYEQKVEGYVNALLTDISSVRKEAALELGKLGDNSIVDQLLVSLRDEGDETVVPIMLSTLEKLALTTSQQEKRKKIMSFRNAYISLPLWMKDIVSREKAYDVFSIKGALKETRKDSGTQFRSSVRYDTSIGNYYASTTIYTEKHKRSYAASYLEGILIKAEFGDPTLVESESTYEPNTYGAGFMDEYSDWEPRIPDKAMIGKAIPVGLVGALQETMVSASNGKIVDTVGDIGFVDQMMQMAMDYPGITIAVAIAAAAAITVKIWGRTETLEGRVRTLNIDRQVKKVVLENLKLLRLKFTENVAVEHTKSSEQGAEWYMTIENDSTSEFFIGEQTLEQAGLIDHEKDNSDINGFKFEDVTYTLKRGFNEEKLIKFIKSLKPQKAEEEIKKVVKEQRAELFYSQLMQESAEVAHVSSPIGGEGEEVIEGEDQRIAIAVRLGELGDPRGIEWLLSRSKNIKENFTLREYYVDSSYFASGNPSGSAIEISSRQVSNPDYSAIQRAIKKLQQFESSRNNAPIGDPDVGGIDMNEINVKRQGSGVDIQFSQEAIQSIIDMGIDGFAPVIINLTPISSILPMLGLAPEEKESEKELSSLGPMDRIS